LEADVKNEKDSAELLPPSSPAAACVLQDLDAVHTLQLERGCGLQPTPGCLLFLSIDGLIDLDDASVSSPRTVCDNVVASNSFF
jgi:hypothetical protein